MRRRVRGGVRFGQLLVACVGLALSQAQASLDAEVQALESAPTPKTEFMETAAALLARAEAGGDLRAAARVELAVTRHLRNRGLWDVMEAHARAAADYAGRAGDQSLLRRAELAIAGSLVQRDQLPEAQQRLLSVLERARADADVEAEANALLVLSSAAGRGGDMPAARAWADEGIAVASAADLPETWLRLLINRTRIARVQKQAEIAEADLAKGLELAPRVSAPDVLQSLMLAEIAIRQPDDAGARLEAVAQDAADRQQPYLQGFALVFAGRTHCTTDAPGHGLELLRRGAELMRGLDAVWDLSAALMDLAACQRANDDLAGAYDSALEARSTAIAAFERRRADVIASMNLQHRNFEQRERLARSEIEAEKLSRELAQGQRNLGWLLAIASFALMLAAWLGFRLRLRAAEVRAAQAGQRARVEVLGITSHEIRNPVQGLLGTLDRLRRDETDPQRRLQLDSAQAAADLIARVAGDALDLALIEQGRFSLRRRRCDPDALVRASLTLVEPEARSRGIELRYVGGPACSVQVDPDRFRQVLLNLLGNALRYTREGAVEVRARIGGGCWRLEVADEGPGIAESERERVFEAGFRGSASTADTSGGGMGLAISRLLIEAQGGRLWVLPGLARGATLVLELPLAAGGAETPAPEPQAQGALAGRRVLVIDDDEFSRLGIRSLLESAGAQVQELAGEEGIEAQLREQPPDLVLCDRHLAGSDGSVVAARIRAMCAHTRTRVLLISGSAGPGGTEVLLKPLSLAELLRALSP